MEFYRPPVEPTIPTMLASWVIAFLVGFLYVPPLIAAL